MKGGGVMNRFQRAKKMGFLLPVLLLLALPATVLAEPKLQLNTHMLDATSRKVVTSVSQEGPINEIFRLQKSIVSKVLNNLGISRESLPKAVQQALDRPPTRSFKAFVAYSVGLDLFDQGRFADARVAFRKATSLDPTFQEATIQERQTPRVDISLERLKRSSMNRAIRRANSILRGRITATTTPTSTTYATAVAVKPSSGSDRAVVVEDIGEGDFDSQVKGAIREVHETVEHLSDIREEARTGFAAPKELISRGLREDIDVGLIAETVLENLEQANRQDVKEVLEIVGKEGITRHETADLIELLESRGDCQ